VAVAPTHATRSPAGLRRGFAIAVVSAFIGMVLLGVLLSALNAGHHRPEGAAERWLSAISDSGRDGVRDDAVKRASKIGPVSIAEPILPDESDRDGEHRLFADLEVGRATHDGARARVPFLVHLRDVEGEDERTGTLVLAEQADDTWRIASLSTRRAGEKVPSEGGSPPSSAGVGLWVLGAGVAVALAALCSLLVRLAGRGGPPAAAPASAFAARPQPARSPAQSPEGVTRVSASPGATMFRRYIPLALIGALQLAIIAAVPSKAPDEVAADGGIPGGPVEGFPGGVPLDTLPDGSPAPVATLPGGAPAPSATLPGGAPAPGSTGSNGSTGNNSGPSVPVGDTSHCVQGRQFNPADFPWAPPCSPKYGGDNGGATYRGVTKDTIKVVVLRGNYGALVNAVLAAQGSFPSHEQFQAFLAAAAKFINARYELYGRKVQFVEVQLQCSTGGQGVPDDQCLRQEMRQIVAQQNPFAVIWNNAVSSATYDELSRLKVVNFGGYGFTDTFNRNHAPYHWDVLMGGNQLATVVGDWWCRRMHGQKAVYAGRNGAGDAMFERTRVLGVLSTNDPENRVIASLLEAELSKCGARISNKYFYDQNIQTLTQQRAAAVAAMRSEPAATSVFCFCDQVAPQFLYTGFNRQSYFPENLIPATGSMDTDQVGQSMDHGAEDNHEPNEYPQFENAFGLAQYGREEPLTGNTAARVWQRSGGSGAAPYGSAYGDMDYYAMLATMVQAAGPNLTPETLQAGAIRIGRIDPIPVDERFGPRSFSPGDYTWNDAVREVYWSPNRRAPVNGLPGSYASLNGGAWLTATRWPAGPLPLPPKPRP
jgi:hypothetical protein